MSGAPPHPANSVEGVERSVPSKKDHAFIAMKPNRLVLKESAMLRNRLFTSVIIVLIALLAVSVSAQDDGYGEAPMLAALVESGELPPVEERLPANPAVVEPIESVGVYGGTWHRAWRGVNDFHAFGRIIYDPVLRWRRDPNDNVQPGLAESWEWNEDGTALTLNCREGLRWSDGEPFTVDDVIFWWEAIETDPNITSAIHGEWMVGGEP